MIFRFNEAQLGAKMEKALNTLLAEIQSTQEKEIEIIADDFPYNLAVVLDDKSANIAWDVESETYKYVGDPLPVTVTDPHEKVGKIKEWQRPESAQAPEPAQEIKVTVDNIVSQFMGLTPEQRTKFFCEAWRSISEEK